MSQFYVLDDQHRIIDVGDDLHRWGRFFESQDRIVAQTYVGAARAWFVSTVFMGMDHGFGQTELPLLFETMVFWQGKAPLESEWSEYQERWCTWDEAMAGHERICRLHGFAQRKAMEEILDEVGISGAVTAYVSPRNGGKLTLIDGALRQENEADWPTLILDVTDEEADLLLAVLNPLAELAETDNAALEELIRGAQPSGPGLDDLLGQLLRAAQDDADETEAAPNGAAHQGPAAMELAPFEHYDYCLFLFKSSLDWSNAVAKLGLTRVAFVQRDGKSRKIGMGRVIDGARLLALLK